MIAWELIDRATMPGGGGELRLMRRGGEFSIMSGAIELMNSRLSGSEQALADLAWARIADRPAPRLLVGGLGMGFTLRAALARAGPDARITVAELVPAVVGWARGPLAGVLVGCLDDPRVDVRTGDVGDLIGAVEAAFDAILMDVDNGPEGLTRAANDALYAASGLGAARRALRPGGVLAVWSAARDARFTSRLHCAGFGVEEIGVRASVTGRGARHVIWIATKPARPDDAPGAAPDAAPRLDR
jgi:spermidine synthase